MSLAKIRVAIIGGGYSGAMTAVHLLRQHIKSLDVTIIEPRRELGWGLAYSTPSQQHLLNVPASGMSALPDEPDHFLNYAQSKDNSISEECYLPRRMYGEYLSWLIGSALGQQEEGHTQVEHVQAEVVDIEKVEAGYRLYLSDKEPVDADYVVLALGNLSGKKPAWLKGIGMACKNYIHNPWQPGAIEQIACAEDVLIVGTGLTAVDKIIELKSTGHKGFIYAVSRHGLLPRAHLDRWQGMVAPLASQSKTALGALEILRKQIEKTAPSQDGDRWRRVIDGLRSTTQSWWQSLPDIEQRRFLNHLITLWDVHRHRMAPTISEIVEGTRASGQLTVRAGKITNIATRGAKLVVTVCERGKAETLKIEVTRVINCTGPQSSMKTVDSLLLANLLKRGLVAPHRLGAGISARADGQVVDGAGQAVTGMFAIGPMLKAELLESVAVPELREQAYNLGASIARQIQEKRKTAVSEGVA